MVKRIFIVRCLDSKFLVFLNPFWTFPHIYALDSPGFVSRKRQKIFLSAKTVHSSYGAHPAFNSMGAGVQSRVLQRTGHEVDHSPPTSVRGEEWVQLYLIRPQSVDTDKFTLIYFKVLPFIVMTNTGRFITFSVIKNIYNKKTNGPTLMELFTVTGKLKKFFFFFDN